ncbi:hypothetical protein B4U79_08434 [Dinothrombium tinctorium]|uniref:Nbr1 FW domain-containing protein n=1 Tax=Dinothrombium tinctorium TaxID=1965070 RepID=A0A3S3SAT2_9ACAR|nr:hypothetical protein B4U79_08434 [Dinothrombium tinctorium]
MDVEGENGGKAANDIGAELLQRFQCLGTQDKDVLIREFQRFLPPNQLSSEGCAFFLDMNNWNLQQAICAYFDLDAPKDFGQSSLPSMTFVKDVTIGEGEEVPPNTRFTKTWRIQNSGNERWPMGCVLRFVAGDQMTSCERVILDPLEPGHMTDVSVEMLSPSKAGIYQGQWRISTATGQYFGEVIWVILTVAEGGVLGLTQQMDSFHSLGSPVKSVNETLNPFASKSNQVPNYIKQSGICSEPNVLITGEHQIQHQSFLNRLSDNRIVAESDNTCIHDCTTLLNHTSSSGTSSETKASTVNSDSADNHLPPTPPLSEDMML